MHFSLKVLFVATALIALSCVGLLYASARLATCFTTLALLTVLFGVLVAILCSELEKPFWIGFALFGMTYYAFAMFGERAIDPASQSTVAPFGSRSVIVEPRLVTTQFLLYANSLVDGSPMARLGVPVFFRISWFVSIGHAIFTVIFALLGGAIGNWLGRRFAANRDNGQRVIC
jgi:hypothetical protein